jgi:peptidoglycan/LPS O-acetylase OafA/YrhL
MTTPSLAEKPMASPAIPSLDGLRASSIAIVAASHCGLGALIPGGLGVTIFFFLSGYLITTLLLREVADTGTINIGHFYLRRALRLYPPLILTLAIAYTLVHFGVLGGSITMAGFLSQLFYFANYYQLFFDAGGGVPDGTGILWSLAVEEHFYLVYPLFLLGFIRYRRVSGLPVILALLCGAALLWRMHLAAGPDFFAARTYYASDTRFDSILFGCIFAVLSHQRPPDPYTTDTSARYWSLFVAGMVGIMVSVAYRGAFFRETFRYTLQGISLAPIFYFALNARPTFVFRILNSALFKRIGIYSYSIYLFHFIFLAALTRALAGSSRPDLPPLLLFCLIMGGSCAFAFLVDTLIDPYFRRLRKILH